SRDALRRSTRLGSVGRSICPWFSRTSHPRGSNRKSKSNCACSSPRSFGGDVPLEEGTQSCSQAVCQVHVIEEIDILVGITMRAARFSRIPCLVFVQCTILSACA